MNKGPGKRKRGEEDSRRRREGRGKEGICRTHVKLLPTRLGLVPRQTRMATLLH